MCTKHIQVTHCPYELYNILKEDENACRSQIMSLSSHCYPETLGRDLSEIQKTEDSLFLPIEWKEKSDRSFQESVQSKDFIQIAHICKSLCSIHKITPRNISKLPLPQWQTVWQYFCDSVFLILQTLSSEHPQDEGSWNC